MLLGTSTGSFRLIKSSKSNIVIGDVAMDGSFVSLSNKSYTSDMDLSNWSLERTHSSGKSSFKFPESYTLAKGSSVNVYGYAYEDNAKPGDLVAKRSECKSWGLRVGELVLKDNNGATKASCSISEGPY